MSNSRPVWLLDIDGVINSFAAEPNPTVWPHDQWRQMTVAGCDILVAQPVLDFITEVHETGRAEIRWLTQWLDSAPEFAEAVGLPEFPVEGIEDFARLYDPDGRGPVWWKVPAAWRVVGAEGRSLLWTDDDLRLMVNYEGLNSLRKAGSVLLVNPNEVNGLTRKNLREIKEFLLEREELSEKCKE